MIASLTRAQWAWLIAAGAMAVIAGAWIFEHAGYAPCKLCLQQRYAYYAGIPLAVLSAFLARQRPRVSSLILWGVAALFIANAIFGVWHSGVEWGWWPGPADCAPTSQAPLSGGGLLQQMQKTKVISCTEAALRIAGLSLAGWNAVISSALALMALYGALRARAAL
ncbi:MAG: disulfide bond formation protein B [Beijerinckiaceae bacterium]